MKIKSIPTLMLRVPTHGYEGFAEAALLYL